MTYCQVCGEWAINLTHHKCLPEWCVWDKECNETEDDNRPVYAYCPGDAARKFVEERDANWAMEYTDGGKSGVTVCVRERFNPDAKIHTFEVSAAPVLEYCAWEIYTDEDDNSNATNEANPAPPSGDVDSDVQSSGGSESPD